MAATAAASSIACSLATNPKLTTPSTINNFFSGTRLENSKLHCGENVVAAPHRLQIQALKKLQGRVKCNSNDKSVSVEFVRVASHPKYEKRVKTSKTYVVHDPGNICKVGDVVTLAKCAPVSKRKQFVVLEVKNVKEAASPRVELTLPPFEASVVAA